jgi:ABC-type glutathione transport system ATPase component
MTPPTLSLDLSADYRNKPGALDHVRFDIQPGEAFGLVGQSGSGKSTIALAVLRLLEMRGGRTHGTLRFEGRDLHALGERELRRIRGNRIAMVPQSPLSALNPVLRIETHLREAWRAHSRIPWRDARRTACGLLARMGLPADDAFLRRLPHQVSVGQAQRILIAMAVFHQPALLIADEPTSALDPASARDILELLRSLNRDSSMAMLYISHDLASVAQLCTRVAVLESGRVVRCGPVERGTLENTPGRVPASQTEVRSTSGVEQALLPATPRLCGARRH